MTGRVHRDPLADSALRNIGADGDDLTAGFVSKHRRRCRRKESLRDVNIGPADAHGVDAHNNLVR